MSISIYFLNFRENYAGLNEAIEHTEKPVDVRAIRVKPV